MSEGERVRAVTRVSVEERTTTDQKCYEREESVHKHCDDIRMLSIERYILQSTRLYVGVMFFKQKRSESD